MSKDLRFTISIIQEEYIEKRYEPKHEVTVKESGPNLEPVYGLETKYIEEEKIHHPLVVLNEYEQIPLRLADMPFSVVQTNYQSRLHEEGVKICEKIANMGEFCPIEKLMEIVLEANQHHQYKSYHISYGYHYTNESGKEISREFKTQSERNKFAFEEVGYDFDQLDWSDKIAPSKRENDNPKIAAKK